MDDEGYGPEQRAALIRAIRTGNVIRCPACDSAVARHDIAPRRDVSYVRRRVLIICPECGRRAALDVKSRGS